MTPAVATLLKSADNLIALAKERYADGQIDASLILAAHAAEYVRAAKAMQRMEDAFAEYNR